jgi:hypothetical protein
VRGVASLLPAGENGRRLLSVVDRGQLERMLDPAQFLSDFGLRSLSKEHRERPYEIALGGTGHRVAYEPGESSGRMFGENSNWRGHRPWHGAVEYFHGDTEAGLGASHPTCWTALVA